MILAQIRNTVKNCYFWYFSKFLKILVNLCYFWSEKSLKRKPYQKLKIQCLKQNTERRVAKIGRLWPVTKGLKFKNLQIITISLCCRQMKEELTFKTIDIGL